MAINKIETINLYLNTSFRFSLIFRYFRFHKCSPYGLFCIY